MTCRPRWLLTLETDMPVQSQDHVATIQRKGRHQIGSEHQQDKGEHQQVGRIYLKPTLRSFVSRHEAVWGKLGLALVPLKTVLSNDSTTDIRGRIPLEGQCGLVVTPQLYWLALTRWHDDRPDSAEKA